MKSDIQLLPTSQLDTVQYNPMVISDAFRFFESRQTELVAESCRSLGILSPIIVFQKTDNVYCVIDGFKRSQFLISNNVDSVYAYVLPKDTPISVIWKMLLIEHLYTFSLTDTTKAIACHFFKYCGVSRNDLQSLFVPYLGLQSHDQILRNCLKIAKLPKPILEFSHEKKLSLKQCVQFSNCPEDILMSILDLRSRLPLSASMVLNLVGFFQIQVQRHQCSFSSLISKPIYYSLLHSDTSPSEKLVALKALMIQEEYPLVSSINCEIEQIIDSMNLSDSLDIDWDHTLENHEVSISCKVRSEHDLISLSNKLSDLSFSNSISTILDKL